MVRIPRKRLGPKSFPRLNMLRQLRLENFRCFKDHTVVLHPTTVVVGRNNAGKSTLIEALELLALVIDRKGGKSVKPPAWLGESPFRACLSASSSVLEINRDTLFHRYGEPPALITARFTEGATVRVFIGKDETIYATVETKDRWITTAKQLASLGLPWIYTLPQITPLQVNEKLLTDSYIADHLYSQLSSRHFRNQMYRMPKSFDTFKALAESTWPGLRVDPLEITRTKEGHELTMMVKDGDFVAEAAWMGHGLQMWLQTVWFISRTPPSGLAILDEPDVYMHPDLQRKLFRIVSGRFQQSIVATHSVEIMAEAEPGNILVINKAQPRSSYTTNEPALQVLIDNIGGVHNVHLARLWNAKKFLLIEGDDIGLLRHLHAVLFPGADLPIDALPNLPIDGWGGWSHAVGSSMTLHNAFGDEILTYCLLDRDYHNAVQVAERMKEVVARKVELHVWHRKEIENYLLNPIVIQRVLAKRLPFERIPTAADVEEQIHRIAGDELDTVVYGRAELLLSENRSLGMSAHKIAREEVEKVWDNVERRIEIAPGKAVLGKLSNWCQQHYGAAFGAPAIARNFRVHEIPGEISAVLEAIERGVRFSE
jgi:predicted ATPase